MGANQLSIPQLSRSVANCVSMGSHGLAIQLEPYSLSSMAEKILFVNFQGERTVAVRLRYYKINKVRTLLVRVITDREIHLFIRNSKASNRVKVKKNFYFLTVRVNQGQLTNLKIFVLVRSHEVMCNHPCVIHV